MKFYAQYLNPFLADTDFSREVELPVTIHPDTGSEYVEHWIILENFHPWYNFNKGANVVETVSNGSGIPIKSISVYSILGQKIATFVRSE